MLVQDENVSLALLGFLPGNLNLSRYRQECHVVLLDNQRIFVMLGPNEKGSFAETEDPHKQSCSFVLTDDSKLNESLTGDSRDAK